MNNVRAWFAKMPETPKKNAAPAEAGGEVAVEQEKENIFLFVPNLIGKCLAPHGE